MNKARRMYTVPAMQPATTVVNQDNLELLDFIYISSPFFILFTAPMALGQIYTFNNLIRLEYKSIF